MAKAETLSSLKNPLLKEIRRAAARGTLTGSGAAVAESVHLLEEALRGQCPIQAVVAATGACGEVERLLRRCPETRIYVVEESLFRELSTTETSQGVIALVRPPEWSLDQLFGPRSLVVVLDGVQDPGNAGAVLRAAEAFGASGVVFLKGAVHPYHPKTLRASAGSVFRLPLAHPVEGAVLREALDRAGLDVYVAMPEGARSLEEADLTRPCAFLVGSEGRGVSAELRDCGIGLRIPTAGVESLNAAMAATVLLYEARRQRSLRP